MGKWKKKQNKLDVFPFFFSIFIFVESGIRRWKSLLAATAHRTHKHIRSHCIFFLAKDGANSYVRYFYLDSVFISLRFVRCCSLNKEKIAFLVYKITFYLFSCGASFVRQYAVVGCRWAFDFIYFCHKFYFTSSECFNTYIFFSSLVCRGSWLQRWWRRRRRWWWRGRDM